jgi:CheY-like chemotaxis protein
MRLPKISGLEVIRWLEEHPKLAEANTIIAMSAEWASQQNTPSPSSALVRASFSKPFDLEEVLSLVQTHAPKLHSW